MSTNEVTLDLDALKAEIGQLDEAAVREQLTAIKVRQKKQQIKQQSKGSQKAYQAKNKARQQLLKEAAIRLGIYDQINAQAKSTAEAQLAAEDAEPDTDDVDAADETK